VDVDVLDLAERGELNMVEALIVDQLALVPWKNCQNALTHDRVMFYL
jgi:hypothetical protein